MLISPPEFEPLLDKTGRGISVSLEDDTGYNNDMLEVIGIGATA